MRRSARLLVALAAAALGLVACGTTASTPTDANGLKEVKISTVVLLGQSPLFVADKLGYFKQEGLNVTIVPANSGNDASQAMLGGSVQAIATGFDVPIKLTAKGQPVQSMVGLEMKTVYAFVGGKNFPQIPADDPQAFVNAVKGKKFGVAASGSTGDTIARGLFREYGTDPDKDVNIIAVGTGAQATAALQTGAVDALITYEPDLTKMVGAGAGRVVFDLRNTTTEKIYSQLPTTTVMATKSWIDGNPDTAAAIVRAVAKADNVLRTDPGTALPVIQGLFPDLKPEAVQTMYKFSQSHFEPAISKETYESALTIYKQAGVVTSDMPYEQAVATRFSKDWGSTS